MNLAPSLAHPDFRRFLAGVVPRVTLAAALPIALTTALVISGGGAREVGLLLALFTVVRLLVILAGGVVADRVPPHRVIVGGDLVVALAAGALAGLFAAGRADVVSLAVPYAVIGAASAMVQPASVALRPLLVPVELRGEAAGLFSSLTSGAMVAGPVLGGLLVASLGPTWGFVAVGAGSFWSAAWMARVRTRPKPRERESSFLADLAEGAGVVRRVAWLVAGLVSAAAFHLGTGLLIVLLEVTVVRDLGGPSALGWVVGLQGVGGVVGGLIAMRWLGTRLLARGFAMLALTPLLPFALAWPGTLWAVMLGAALSQLGIMAFSVAWDVALQDGIEHRHLARVASWDQLVSFVALPVGAGLAGVVASGARPEVVFTGLGLWLGVAGLIPLAVPAIWRLRRVTVTSPGGR